MLGMKGIYYQLSGWGGCERRLNNDNTHLLASKESCWLVGWSGMLGCPIVLGRAGLIVGVESFILSFDVGTTHSCRGSISIWALWLVWLHYLCAAAVVWYSYTKCIRYACLLLNGCVWLAYQ